MTTMHRCSNGYTVAVDDEGQLDRINTSCGLLDPDLPDSRDAVQAVLAEATATIARLELSATGDAQAENARLTDLVDRHTTTIARLEREAERAEQLHETWKDQLTDDLHRRATEQNLCSQFDDFCQQHGLRGRSADYDVSITISYQTTLTVTAHDDDDARDKASSIFNDSYQFPSTLYTGDYSLTEQDWTTDQVELS